MAYVPREKVGSQASDVDGNINEEDSKRMQSGKKNEV
jgi:hypothetical protein